MRHKGKRNSCSRAHDAHPYARPRAHARDASIPGLQRTTFTVTERTTVAPRRGMRSARTVHVPRAVPRTLVPANLQLREPDVMLRRSRPCDPRGMASPVAPAMRAAVSVRPMRTVRMLAGAPVRAADDCATGRVVVAADPLPVELLPGVVDSTGVVVVVEGGWVVAGTVVAGVVVAGAVVGEVGGTVGATVVVVKMVASPLTAVAALREVLSPVPSWPKVLSPQHCTAPVCVTAHVWVPPAATSTAVPLTPVTSFGE